LRFLEDFLDLANAERPLQEKVYDAKPRGVAQTFIERDQVHGNAETRWARNMRQEEYSFIGI